MEPVEPLEQQIQDLIAKGSTDIFQEIVSHCEQLVIRRVVEHCDGNYSKASRILGISRLTLRNKIGPHPAWPPRWVRDSE